MMYHLFQLLGSTILDTGFLAQVLAFHTQTTFNRGLFIISVVFGLLCEATELKEVIMVLAIFVMSMGIYCQLSKDIYLFISSNNEEL
jgi:hypothetical protein